MDDKRYCSVYSPLTAGDLFGAKLLALPEPLSLGRLEKDRDRLKAVYEQGYAVAAANGDALCAFLHAGSG